MGVKGHGPKRVEVGCLMYWVDLGGVTGFYAGEGPGCLSEWVVFFGSYKGISGTGKDYVS